MPPVNPEHLLDQADTLAKAQGAGSPRDTDLRRANSTAYYAVFHAITYATACHVLGHGAENTEPDAFNNVRRSISHKQINDVSLAISQGLNKSKYDRTIYNVAVGDSDVRDLAAAVEDLYFARLQADYEHGAERLQRTAVLNNIKTARGAVTLVNQACSKTLTVGLNAFCHLLSSRVTA